MGPARARHRASKTRVNALVARLAGTTVANSLRKQSSDRALAVRARRAAWANGRRTSQAPSLPAHYAQRAHGGYSHEKMRSWGNMDFPVELLINAIIAGLLLG